jgi:hypothetical protein
VIGAVIVVVYVDTYVLISMWDETDAIVFGLINGFNEGLSKLAIYVLDFVLCRSR